MSFTIENFWKERLGTDAVKMAQPQLGWEIPETDTSIFVEAPLEGAKYICDTDPQESKIILVSAPGAVGKTTLARTISSATGNIYIDLSKSEPVGGNFLSGGLAKSGIFEAWKKGNTTVLIDGLDEARLRVTQDGFASFLKDVVEMIKDREKPIVLFGRTGSIQDTWLLLAENGMEVPILEIGFYSEEQASAFVLARIRSTKADRSHEVVEKQAIALLLDRLRAATNSDGSRFAGYAPVLMAVADTIAGEPNPSELVSKIQQGSQVVTPQTVVTAIMNREQDKIKVIRLSSETRILELYNTSEQLDRICSLVYGTPPPALPDMPAADAKVYAEALAKWVPEHPFLDGHQNPSSVVFAAQIAAHALHSSEFEEYALKRELARGHAANPFLADFYLGPILGLSNYIKPEHTGILYSSIRATLSLGDSASLQIEPQDEDADDEKALDTNLEISVSRKNNDKSTVFELDSDQAGTIILGQHIEDVSIFSPLSKIDCGSGEEASFISPINIQCEILRIGSRKVVFESPTEEKPTTIHLECNEFLGETVSAVPIIRGRALLSVVWPNSSAFPWTKYSTCPTSTPDPRIDEGLRRLRKFVIAFRSHSKGSLRRLKDKIDHSRMTKGVGQAILNALQREKIITTVGEMYDLNADLLGEKLGCTYADSVRRKFPEKTIAFIKENISTSE